MCVVLSPVLNSVFWFRYSNKTLASRKATVYMNYHSDIYLHCVIVSERETGAKQLHKK